jgi:hypothetical protein
VPDVVLTTRLLAQRLTEAGVREPGEPDGLGRSIIQRRPGLVRDKRKRMPRVDPV